MEWYEAVALGCAGGALPDVLRLVLARHDDPPHHLIPRPFWISAALLVSLGGLATYLVSPSSVVEALAVGFSAPAILSRLLSREVRFKATFVNLYYQERLEELPTRRSKLRRHQPRGLVAALRHWWSF